MFVAVLSFTTGTLSYSSLLCCCMKRSPNIMVEHQASFSSLGEESARDYASRRAQLSVRGKQVLDQLLALLPSHLRSQPMSCISPLPPVFHLSICDVLQHDRADTPAERDNPSILPSVLSRLRDWRLLDQNYRYSVGGIHRLALDLTGITEEASASTTSDVSRTSHPRLRIQWVASDSHDESQDREASSSTPPSSPSSSQSDVLGLAQACAPVLPDLNQRRFDTGFESCQAGRLGTPDSEDASAVVPQRRHSGSGFRSGCSACRHPRLSGPSNPHMASFKQRTPFCDVNLFDRHINTHVASPRHSKSPVQRVTTKKTKRENQTSLQSIPRGAHVDENEPPLPKPPSVQQGITGILFPRQRTHSPRISNAILSREPFSPVATSVQRRMEPSKYNLPNRTREGDKHTFSHRVASVDLLLPIANPSHTPTRASPIDLHPHTPNRAHSFSFTSVHPHGFGSVIGGIPKLPSNTVGRSSSKPLPSWSATHPRDLARTTTTSVILNATDSLSSTPAKARSQNARLSAPSRPWIPPSLPSMVKPRRSVSSQTHKHAQSAGCISSSPLLTAQKWQV